MKLVLITKVFLILSLDIEEFGAEMEKTLQECFDFYCSFKLLHERVRIHLQKASNDLMKLYDKASGLVPDGTECTLFEGKLFVVLQQ